MGTGTQGNLWSLMAKMSPLAAAVLAKTIERRNKEIVSVDYAENPIEFLSCFGPVWSKMREIIKSVQGKYHPR